MKLSLGGERQVQCSCGKWASEHEIMVRSDSHGRRVGVHTHAESLHHKGHRDRLDHIANFFEKMDAASAQLEAQIKEGGRLHLEKGDITEIDLCYVMPDACGQYMEAMPEFTVRAFGLTESFRMNAIVIEGLDMDVLIESVKTNARALVEILGERYRKQQKSGKF